MPSSSFLLQLPGATTILVLTLAFSVAGLLWFPGLIDRCVLRPYWLVRRSQWHTLVSSGLVHADFGHLLLNMLTFWFFAFQVERVIGTARFVQLYVLALVVSDIGTFLKHRHDPEYGSLGASGAVAAVLFASIVYFPDQSLFIIPIPVPIPAPLFAVGYVAFSWYSARRARGRINHDAHLGGALFGLLFVALTDPAAFGGLARALG
ncbi:MAG: rhomboid family intramembrane serine protease [Gammaproteobacteria bacterium]|nr:rhomboid family intramembrane serine protease [Gammaproteobacteria bacterium]